MLLSWSDSYLLGIPAIDAEHKTLLTLINRFLSQAQDGAAGDVLQQLLQDLIRATREHFEKEELALDRCHFPLLAAHSDEHRRLIERLSYFLGTLRDGLVAGEKAAELNGFLHRWLFDHIENEDRAYRPFLRTLT